MAMMAIQIGLCWEAISSGANAAEASTKVENSLLVHEAKQTGTFESIQSQLATLRVYHSTLRGEMKEQRKLLDELLRHSGTIHNSVE